MSNIIETIKQKGYWRVVIRPARSYYNNNRIDLSKLKNIIRNAKVSLRGWDYPHLEENDIKIIGQNAISSECSFEGEIEHWEFMTSGQFVHIFSIQEDYIIDEKKAESIKSRFHFNQERAKDINKFLSVVSTIYRFTEIYLFASNLVQQNEYGEVDEVEFIIEMHDVKDRLLFFWEFGRDLWSPYVCNIRDGRISFTELYKKNDLIAKFDSLALKLIVKTFNYFGWLDPGEQILGEDQKKLLERRL